MKTKIFVTLLIIASASLAGVAIACREAAPAARASELHTKSGTPPPLPAALPEVSARAIQKYARTEVITQKAYGVDISVANFRYENSEVMVDVCFQMLDNADWRVWDASLQAGDQKLLLSTIVPVERSETLGNGNRLITTFPPGASVKFEELPSDGQPGYICETLAFFPPPSGADLSRVKLVIESIGAAPREGEECSYYLNRVQSMLDARGIGIKLDCVKQEGWSQFVIVRKPDSMSQEQAERLVSSDEFFTVKGPWVFPGSIR